MRETEECRAGMINWMPCISVTSLAQCLANCLQLLLNKHTVSRHAPLCAQKVRNSSAFLKLLGLNYGVCANGGNMS